MSVAHQQALQLLEDGLSFSEVERQLVFEGMPAEQAATVVSSLESYALAQGATRPDPELASGTGGIDILLGLGLMGLGLIITLISFSAASSGGSYIIALGPVVVGGMRLVKGLANG